MGAYVSGISTLPPCKILNNSNNVKINNDKKEQQNTQRGDSDAVCTLHGHYPDSAEHFCAICRARSDRGNWILEQAHKPLQRGSQWRHGAYFE